MFILYTNARISRHFVFLVRAAGERLLQEKCRQPSLQPVHSRIDHAAHVLVCPTCKHSECLPQAIGARTVEVLWVGFETRFQVQVTVRVRSGGASYLHCVPLKHRLFSKFCQVWFEHQQLCAVYYCGFVVRLGASSLCRAHLTPLWSALACGNSPSC
jgi:uncharacterized protein YbaR (Trm112 family)